MVTIYSIFPQADPKDKPVTINVGKLEIKFGGTRIDFLMLDPKTKKITIWAGANPLDDDDMNGAELLPSMSTRNRIFKQVAMAVTEGRLTNKEMAEHYPIITENDRRCIKEILSMI